MAIYHQDIADIELNSGSIFRNFLKHSIGLGDAAANRFGVRVFRDGDAETLSGVSCQGFFRNANGENIALTSYGTVSGNEAYVTLPQACYTVEGRFTLAIKLVGGGVTGTMRIIDGVVDNTNTGSPVAPTSSVPTYQEIIAQYDAMVAATNVANNAIAPDYTALSFPISAGTYCLYNGTLYRANQDIPTNEAWTSSHWTAAQIGPDVSDLKSAINNDLKKKIATFTYTEGYYVNYNGGLSSGNNFAYSSPVAVSKGEKVLFTAQGYSTNLAMIYLCDSTGDNRTVVSRSSGTEVKVYEYFVQSDGYVGFSFDVRQTHEAYIVKTDSVLVFGDRVDNVEGTVAVNVGILEVSKKSVDSTAASYCILESGLSQSKSGYSLQKYSVTAGEKVLIKSTAPDIGLANYVFSSSSNISASSTSNIISVVTEKVNGEITVPSGAKWLVFSVKNIDNVTGVYTSPFVGTTEKIDDLNDRLGMFEYPSIFSLEDTSPIEYSVLNSNGTISTNPSSLSKNAKVSGKIYLSSDMVVSYNLASSDSYPLINEYDENDVFLRVVVRGQGQSVPIAGTYTIGENAAYIRVAYVTTYVDCSLSALHTNENRISSIEDKVQELINGEIQSTSIVRLNEGFSSKAIQAQRRLNVHADYQTKPNILRLLHFSDIHGDAVSLARIVEFKNYYTGFIDDAICTGDMVRNVFADGMDFWDSATGSEDILMCIGNHDVAVTGDYGHYGVTVQQAYNQYFAPYISNWGVVHNGTNTYWYKDYTDQKIRMIALDYLLSGDDATAQNTWLASVLADAKSNGYAVVGIEHTPPVSRTKIPCTFTGLLNDFSGQFGEPYLGTVQNFIDGGGIFLCWLAGHTHVDYVEYHPDYPDQVFIIVTAAKSGTGYEDGDRVIGDKSQDAFNMVYLDADARLVKLVRIGQDRDAHLRSINTLTLDTKTSPATVVWND